MTRIKICGITSVEDAVAAAAAGADALGLIFVPGTPRYVSLEQAAAIVAELPPFVTRVGVFADAPLDELLGIADGLRLHAVQLHGHESEEFSRRLPLPVIRALRVRDASSLQPLETYPARVFLLDAYAQEQLGGTGMAVPQELAIRAAGRRPVILAGGLRPETVAEAVRVVRPYGVDVCSGVERSPGRKDHRKVREFIVNVRHTDLG